MKTKKTIKIGLIAGIAVFLLTSILATYETVQSVKQLKRSASYVKEYKNTEVSLQIIENML